VSLQCLEQRELSTKKNWSCKSNYSFVIVHTFPSDSVIIWNILTQRVSPLIGSTLLLSTSFEVPLGRLRVKHL
jgi:hypothetical protein